VKVMNLPDVRQRYSEQGSILKRTRRNSLRRRSGTTLRVE
jgi:hypothetical protein